MFDVISFGDDVFVVWLIIVFIYLVMLEFLV